MVPRFPLMKLVSRPWIVLFSAGALASCGDSASPYYEGGDFAFEFTHDGLDRRFIMHVPVGLVASKRAPLLLVFHGSASDGAWTQTYTGIDEPADQAGFIVAYPNAAPVGSMTWAIDANTAPDRDGIDDLGFVERVIELVVGEMNIDEDRIYAAGFSNGALFTHRVGCVLGKHFAGIASVAGTMLTKVSGYCDPGGPMKGMFFHGTNDGTMGWNGTDNEVFQMLSAEGTAARWAQLMSCASNPEVTAMPDVVADSTTVERRTFTGCVSGGETVFYAVLGGGHVWPGSDMDLPLSGCTTRDIRASDLIIEFFSEGTYTAPDPGPRATREGCERPIR